MIRERGGETMSTEQMIRIEMEGLCETIIQYSNDNYIISYAKQLRNTSYQEDKEIFLILIERLYQWYEREIERIKESEYTLGKEAHLRSFELLRNIQNKIKK